jgi:hypothetical protein
VRHRPSWESPWEGDSIRGDEDTGLRDWLVEALAGRPLFVLGMAPGSVATIRHRAVVRLLDGRHWNTGDGPRSLLVTIDAVAGGWVDDTTFPRDRPPGAGVE